MHETLVGAQNYGDRMKRLAIAFFQDERGIVDDYMIFLLREIRKHCSKIILVANGPLDPGSEAAVKTVVEEILIRPNEDFNVGGYQAGLNSAGYRTFQEYDEILLFDHTFYGPIYAFSELFSAMETRPCDFWGITAHKAVDRNPLTGTGALPFHINAYFMAIRRNMFMSPSFESYWESLPQIKNSTDTVARHESQFTKHFNDLGYTSDVYGLPAVSRG